MTYSWVSILEYNRGRVPLVEQEWSPFLSSPRFLVGFVLLNFFVFCVMFCRSLFVLFSFDHSVVWPSSIYRLWLPLWYLQTLLTKRNINKDGQQFHQYQQNEQPPQTIKQLKKRKTWSLKSRSSFGTGTNMWLGLTSCMYFFSLLYCSISNKSHVQTILVIVICFHQIFHISSFLLETTKKIVWLYLWCFTCYFWDTRVWLAAIRVFDLLP